MIIVQLGSLRGQVLVASQAGDLEIYRCHVKTGSATPFQMLKQKLGSIQVKPWAALLPEEKGLLRVRVRYIRELLPGNHSTESTLFCRLYTNLQEYR